MNLSHYEEDVHVTTQAIVNNIRRDVNNMSNYLQSVIPPGRRRSEAMTRLEDFSFWAVKAAVTKGE